MGKVLHLKLLFISLGGWPFLLFPQEWEKIKSIKLSQIPTAYSVDIQKNIYLGFKDGGMTKYDSMGNESLNYSLSNLSAITLIEAQNNLKTFLFYFDNQQIIILDRFNSVPKKYYLSDFDVNLALMASPAPDGHYWVIENNPRQLKKIDPIRQMTILETQVSLGDSISFMKAYQNLLLIADENGLHIFDSFGFKLNTIKNLNLEYFHFEEELIFTYDGQNILQLNPFNGTIFSKIHSPSLHIKATLKVKDNYVFITEKEMTFYILNAK